MMRRILFCIASLAFATSAGAALNPLSLDLPPLRYSAQAWAPNDTASTASGRSILAMTGITPWGAIRTYVVWIEPNLSDQPSIARIDSTSIPGVVFGDIDLADYNRDGLIDVAVAGRITSVVDSLASTRTYVYRQTADVNGNPIGFTEEANIRDPRDVAVDSCAVQWVDFDVDGEVDLLVTGRRRDSATESGSTVIRSSSVLYFFRNELDGTTRNFVLDDGIASRTNQIIPVYGGDFDWGDMDADGDPDLVITGLNVTSLQGGGVFRDTLTNIYVNEPPGVLTLSTFADLPGRYDAGVAWGDFNKDGWLDIALAGHAKIPDGGNIVLKVYENLRVRNQANFAEVSIQLDQSSAVAGPVEWIDVDNDGWVDLVAMGKSDAWADGVRYYRNQQNATFDSLETDHGSFPPLTDGAFSIGHLDGNGTVDVITSGHRTDSGVDESAAWLNDRAAPSGDLVTPSLNLSQLTIADNQIIFVWNRPGAYTDDPNITYEVMMYFNAGGLKVLSNRASFQVGAHGSGSAFRLHRSLAPNPSMPVYVRTSAWSQARTLRVQDFVVSLQNIEPVQLGAASWVDVDNDGWADLTVNGYNQGLSPTNRLYLNDEGSLQPVATEDFNMGGLIQGGPSWGDVDGDGYIDVLMTGSQDASNRTTRIHRNLSSGTAGRFSSRVAQYTDETLPRLTGSRAAMGDIDNDGDIDAVVTGVESATPITYLIVNQGVDELGVLQVDVDTLRLGLADLDPDDPNYSVKGADGLFDGWLSLHDIDQDGDLDLTVQGNVDANLDDGDNGAWNNYMGGYLVVYRNDGARQFSPWHVWDGANVVTEIPVGSSLLDQLGSGQHAWVDVDDDGDPDLVAIGYSSVSTERVLIGHDWDASALRTYENIGAGELSMKQAFDGLYHASITVADVDNDNDADLVVSGYDDHGTGWSGLPEGDPIIRYYINDGSGTFAFEDIGLFSNSAGYADGAVRFADMDHDNDLDLIANGLKGLGQGKWVPESRLYSNTSSNSGLFVNTPPSMPTDLVAAVDTTDAVTLSWSPSIDQSSLTYTMRVGTTFGGHEIRPGVEAVGQGGLGYVTSARLSNLADGEYDWAVQAVDAGFLRSSWSISESFIIDTTPPRVAGIEGDTLGVSLSGALELRVDLDDALTGVDTLDAANIAVQVELPGDDPADVVFAEWAPGDVWVGEVSLSVSRFLSEPMTVSISGVSDQRGNPMPDTTFSKQLTSPAVTIVTENLGGTIQNAARTIELYFPPNTFSSDVGVALVERDLAELPAGPSGASPIGVVAQFEPDVSGLTFQRPVVLKMSYDAAAQAGAVHVFRLSGTSWAYVGGNPDAAGSTVSTSITEFGTYALFEADGSTNIETLSDLKCVPRVFSPGVDVFREPAALSGKAAITFSVAQADAGGTATVMVYNRAGRLVRKLDDEAVASGSNSIEWDGRDDGNDVVPSGLFIVVVEIGGTQGTQTVVVLDKYARP